MIKAVLWDFGGVITSSPFEAFNSYESTQGLPRNFIRSVNSTNPDTNAWAQLECSQAQSKGASTSCSPEVSELAGHRVSGTEVLSLLSVRSVPGNGKGAETDQIAVQASAV